MKVSFEDLLKRTQEEGIPYGAIFSAGNPKKLVWGAWEILNTLYRNVLDWYYISGTLSPDDVKSLYNNFTNNEHVAVFCYRKHEQNYHNTIDVNFALLCDDELKNLLELSGGLEQYAKIGG